MTSQADGERDFYWRARDSALLIKGGANYSYEQVGMIAARRIARTNPPTAPAAQLLIHGSPALADLPFTLHALSPMPAGERPTRSPRAAQINTELTSFLHRHYELAAGSAAVAVVGLRVASEHEDECCATIELLTPEAEVGALACTQQM